MESIETCNFSPRFAVRKPDGLWIRLVNEPLFTDKEAVFKRKRELKDLADMDGKPDQFRVIKQKGKHYIYKKQ